MFLPKMYIRILLPRRNTFRDATSSSFRGGQFLWTFIRWRHRVYSTVIQLFRKRSQIKFSSQHFRKWELFIFNQARN